MHNVYRSYVYHELPSLLDLDASLISDADEMGARRHARLLSGEGEDDTSSAISSRGRSVSFSSKVMLSGAFPASTKMWEPVITVVLYFNTCPSVAKLVEVAKKLLSYDRMRSTVQRPAGEGTAGAAGTGSSSRANKGSEPPDYSFVDLQDSINIEEDLIESLEVYKYKYK